MRLFLCRNQRHRAPDYGVVCGQSCRWHSVHPARVPHYAAESMVAQAGQPPGWPVSVRAGILTPVWAIAIERENSGDSVTCYLTEAAIMATTLTPSHPEFVFVFAAVRRADRHPRICMLRTVAGDERSARRSLVRDYVLSLAARLPVVEVSRA